MTPSRWRYLGPVMSLASVSVQRRSVSSVDHYTSVLGVKHTDSLGVVKSSFRRLAKRHHPDVGGEHACERRMAEILEAYQRALEEFDEGVNVGSSRICQDAEVRLTRLTMGGGRAGKGRENDLFLLRMFFFNTTKKPKKTKK